MLACVCILHWHNEINSVIIHVKGRRPGSCRRLCIRLYTGLVVVYTDYHSNALTEEDGLTHGLIIVNGGRAWTRFNTELVFLVITRDMAKRLYVRRTYREGRLSSVLQSDTA